MAAPRPGPNPLLFAVLGAVLLATASALLAGDGRVWDSTLIYRLVVGGLVFALAYVLIWVIHLAWHRKLLQRLELLGAGAEAPPEDEERMSLQQTLGGYAAMAKRAETTERTIDALGRQLARTSEQLAAMTGRSDALLEENRALREENRALREENARLREANAELGTRILDGELAQEDEASGTSR